MLKVVSYSVEEDRQCVVVEHLWLLTAGSEGPKKVLKWEGGGCLSMDEGQRGADGKSAHCGEQRRCEGSSWG